ncbi:alpha/beta hydrolase family protein [Gordonia sp. VNK1]|uniref:alpha/beta hydrolase family protein n=1 Tax=Gordonia oleivorans TaxID=3156618 RepID=UPI0032B3D27D
MFAHSPPPWIRLRAPEIRRGNSGRPGRGETSPVEAYPPAERPATPGDKGLLPVATLRSSIYHSAYPIAFFPVLPKLPHSERLTLTTSWSHRSRFGAQRESRMDSRRMADNPDAAEVSMWFGTDSAAYFATFIPAKREVGAVVVCPPIGVEYMNTYRGLRRLGRQLAASGVTAMIIDYIGTGDSVGDRLADDAITLWTQTVCAAVDSLSAAGHRNIGLIGLRVGALVAAAAVPQRDDIGFLALWDPVESGRTFLREQLMRRRLLGGSGRGVVGQPLSPAATSDLAAQSLSQCLGPTIVFGRSERAPVGTTMSRWRDISDQVVLVDGQEDFVTPESFHVTEPLTAFDTIVAEVRSRFPAQAYDARTPDGSDRITFVDDGVRLHERVLSVGSRNLFAILTERAPDAPREQRCPTSTVVLAAAGTEPHSGVGGMWVRVARMLAAEGTAVLRFDRCGVGLSRPAGPGRSLLYSRQSKRDIVDMGSFARSSGGSVVAAGSCSGAWHSYYAARRGVADGVVMVNLTFWPTRIVAPIGAWALSPTHFGTATGKYKATVAQLIPRRIRSLLARVGLWQSPDPMLATLTKRAVRASILLVDEDDRWFHGRSEVDWARQSAPTVSVTAIGDGDHSLYLAESHSRVSAEVHKAVLDLLEPEQTSCGGGG